jgi:diguanylate cyclase (GGDEF)-like protein
MERLIRTQRLPSPSATALKVLKLADQKEVSVVEIADAIAADPAIAARLLKYANSPLVAPREAITTIQRAVVILGIRAVKVTALGFSLVKRQDFSRCPHFNFDLFWAHATATATAARGIISIFSPGLQDEAFVAGLLARIGKLALATAIPEEYEQVLVRAGNVMRGATAEERATFGTDNIEVGAELLSRWKLPTLLVEAVRHQADPDAAEMPEVKHLAHAVRLGREIADILCGLTARNKAPTVEHVARCNLDQIKSQFEELAGVLNISLNDLPEPDEIEGRARGLLEEMSVAAQAENNSITAKNRQLEQIALADPLTGIGNRKAFDQHLAAELERSRRYGKPMSLLMMDIDRFKQVNDTYGHVAGDAVLKEVATLIRTMLRGCDFAARYGGEEFAVIAGETGIEAAGQLAERLRLAIQGRRIAGPKGPLQITVSIGVASVGGGCPGIEPIHLVAAADRMLYQAKESGRNCCCHSMATASESVTYAV